MNDGPMPTTTHDGKADWHSVTDPFLGAVWLTQPSERASGTQGHIPLLGTKGMLSYSTVAVAEVLFYVYIYLSLATGRPLKATAPTFSLQRSALTFETLGLLLPCGVNEHDACSPNRLLCRLELPLSTRALSSLCFMPDSDTRNDKNHALLTA